MCIRITWITWNSIECLSINSIILIIWIRYHLIGICIAFAVGLKLLDELMHGIKIIMDVILFVSCLIKSYYKDLLNHETS